MRMQKTSTKYTTWVITCCCHSNYNWTKRSKQTHSLVPTARKYQSITFNPSDLLRWMQVLTTLPFHRRREEHKWVQTGPVWGQGATHKVNYWILVLWPKWRKWKLNLGLCLSGSPRSFFMALTSSHHCTVAWCYRRTYGNLLKLVDLRQIFDHLRWNMFTNH